MKNKRWIRSLMWIFLGIGLLTGNLTGLLDDYWGGMGVGFLGVGVVRLIQLIRYRTSETYREAVDVAQSDERNQFLSQKAWAWTGYLFVLIMGVVTIILQLTGLRDAATLTGGSICLMLVLYWLSWLWLRKKY